MPGWKGLQELLWRWLRLPRGVPVAGLQPVWTDATVRLLAGDATQRPACGDQTVRPLCKEVRRG